MQNNKDAQKAKSIKSEMIMNFVKAFSGSMKDKGYSKN